MTVIPELVNLGNGSAAAGDRIAVKICRDAIAEIERLQTQLRRGTARARERVELMKENKRLQASLGCIAATLLTQFGGGVCSSALEAWSWCRDLAKATLADPDRAEAMLRMIHGGATSLESEIKAAEAKEGR